MNEKKTEKRRGLGILWIVALVLALVGGLIPVAAKYVTARQEPENLVLTNNFYFTSNYLDTIGSGSQYREIRVNAGTTSLDIELYNFDDELRVSELDINYTIEITGVTKSDGTAAPTAVVNAASITPANGTISRGPEQNTATVTLSGLESGYNYTVKAVGRNGYEKELAAVFKVDPAPSAVYMSLDTSNRFYVELTVWTTGENAVGPAAITAPISLLTLVPDYTDPVMRNWSMSQTNTDTVSFLHPESSYTYRFYKLNLLYNCTIENFAVVINGIDAVEGTP